MCEGGVYGVAVSVQTSGEGMQVGQVGAADLDDRLHVLAARPDQDALSMLVPDVDR